MGVLHNLKEKKSALSELSSLKKKVTFCPLNDQSQNLSFSALSLGETLAPCFFFFLVFISVSMLSTFYFHFCHLGTAGCCVDLVLICKHLVVHNLMNLTKQLHHSSLFGRYWLRPGQTLATLLANKTQCCWAQHVASVCTPCCVLLGVVATCWKLLDEV